MEMKWERMRYLEVEDELSDVDLGEDEPESSSDL
jgi:hypothetical protein